MFWGYVVYPLYCLVNFKAVMNSSLNHFRDIFITVLNEGDIYTADEFLSGDLIAKLIHTFWCRAEECEARTKNCCNF